jgi:hypothetical protein
MNANTLSKIFLLWFQKNNQQAKIYRNNSGCFKTEAGNWVRYGIPVKGGSDFIAFIPEVLRVLPLSIKVLANATCEFYEIKTLKDRMSKDQINFANMICEMGFNYFIVREIKEMPYFKIEQWEVN